MTAFSDPRLTVVILILAILCIALCLSMAFMASTIDRLVKRIDRIERRFKDDNERLTQTQRTLDIERRLRIELLNGVNRRISSIADHQKGQHRAMRALRRERDEFRREVVVWFNEHMASEHRH